MDPLSEKIRKMIASKQLKISMSEVARVTGVSTSQLRYWEKKGYIKSEQDKQNKNHYFSCFFNILYFIINPILIYFWIKVLL